jgi:quercetin dioxygenase-like cupin family protein
MSERSTIRRNRGYRWDGVSKLEYKTQGSHFDRITRQTLLGGSEEESEGSAVTRYFEIAPGGHSTLERHEHTHMVVVVRGSGSMILGEETHDLRFLDAVYIAPRTFHQFHATGDEPFGFLCVVDRERDRPQLPQDSDLETLRRNPEVARLLKT